MITKHIINNSNKEEVLYLYFDFNNETGEIGKMNNNKNILNQVKEYIMNKKIKFNGKKIVLVALGVVVSIIFTNDIYKNNLYSNHQYDYVNRVILYDYDEQLNLSDNYEVIINKNNTSFSEENKIFDQKNETSEKIELDKSSNINTNKITDNYKSNLVTNNTNTNINNEKQVNEIQKNKNLVTVYRSNGTVLEIDIEEYVIGVVGAEMPASFNIEALKAQAIVSRTYAAYQIKAGNVLTDTVKTQVYKDISQLQKQWGTEFDKYYNKVKQAVESTEGMYIMYNNEYINAVYFSTSNGYTEDAKQVWNNYYPYLVSVESSWDKTASSYIRTVEKTYQEVYNILGIDVNVDSDIYIIDRNSSGRVNEIQLSNNRYTGLEIRNLFGLRSADFDIEKTDTGLKFTTRGYGHGVGFSQYGANGMAKEGYNFRQIIKHYYKNIEIKTIV
ncbi:MAG TPA: stage II sporulation protein D [Tenericutes bacterium]|nr:stage II sporulation protein D [Mycoplasmatota bacterium]